MGILGFLQFALKCVDLFAWPIFALAYPLFASIRAIETNSNHHMRKLVTYWILFSLISLFEHTFVKFLEWFPLWAYIKIVAIWWLVLPRFGHSYIAYKSILLLRSYVNLQIINWSNKQDKEPFLKTEETFLSVAEKFIKENGSEALEELITNKLFQSKLAKPNLDAKEKMAVTITEKKEMVTTIESKGAKPDMEEIKATANTEEKEKATKIKSVGAKPNLNAEEIKVANTEKKEMAAIDVKRANTNLLETERRKPEVVEVKEMNYYLSSSDEVQRQWTCAVCQVTTTSQTTLNSHFRGKKHLAKCQELKAKMQTPKNDYSPLSSTTNKLGQANQNPNKGISGDGVNRTKSKRQETKVQLNNGNIKSKKDNAEKKHWCTVCNVRCSGQIDLVSHLKGKKHLSKVGS
ncbi:hypothetical protein LguiB_006938 [Lonicera macranthoides]